MVWVEVTPQKAFTVYRTGGEPGGEQWPGKDEGNLTVKKGTYDFYFDQNPHNVIIMPAGITPFVVAGTCNDWGETPLEIENGWMVAKNVTFSETEDSPMRFKIRLAGDSDWNAGYNLGLGTDNGNGSWTLVNAGGDITVDSGTYDIYFDLGAMQVWVMTPGNTPSQN